MLSAFTDEFQEEEQVDLAREPAGSGKRRNLTTDDDFDKLSSIRL